ncbi:MAG: cytochrome P450 [Sulfuricurvum sp.]|uniref:cytochrome P450 n=1 Tax=Sulfuricurvum sp. TaxID=2025608 RepID=UPI002618CC6E|nr:cytochrome P450 [Sulfuricurvum sp.]MDD2828394.1 cytochrome P450 [Sulfuricurvum sp.]MDD4949399.1 cytochrome P450 [Sulfuricurvum sp.]
MSSCPFHQPFFPPPLKNKASLLFTFFRKRRSWLDGLYERSYSMKMGRVKMPGLDLHVINQPDLVHRILVDEVKEFPKNQLLGHLLEPLLGESIFTTNGEQWKRQREMLNPSFEMTRISHVFGLMNDAVQEMKDHLRGDNTENHLDIDPEMTYVTADIIFRTILSSRLDRNDAVKIIEAFVTFQEETARTAMRTMFKIPEWLWFLSGENKRIKAGNDIRDILASIIRPRYDAIIADDTPNNKDILSSLLQAVDVDSGEKFSFEEILDQVAMLFLAGHETSASALTWATYLLSLYPEIQERAYHEVLNIAGEDEFNADQLKHMELITNIFKETLRLYPPVGFFARENTQETTMRDKTIAKGSSVVVAPWLIHRHKEFWENPNGFDPDRFSDPKSIHKDTYLPFGMGARICIGSSFAMQEAVLILATLIREFKIELQEGFVPDVVGRLTVRSANGMKIILKRRTH